MSAVTFGYYAVDLPAAAQPVVTDLVEALTAARKRLGSVHVGVGRQAIALSALDGLLEDLQEALTLERDA